MFKIDFMLSKTSHLDHRSFRWQFITCETTRISYVFLIKNLHFNLNFQSGSQSESKPPDSFSLGHDVCDCL
jgi:hypothetical protein